MVKPFRLTYLAKGEGWWHHPSPLARYVSRNGIPPEISTIACLTFCLLLTDRPILGLLEYKLEAVNICKMHGTGDLEVVVLKAF